MICGTQKFPGRTFWSNVATVGFNAARLPHFRLGASPGAWGIRMTTREQKEVQDSGKAVYFIIYVNVFELTLLAKR